MDLLSQFTYYPRYPYSLSADVGHCKEEDLIGYLIVGMQTKHINTFKMPLDGSLPVLYVFPTFVMPDNKLIVFSKNTVKGTKQSMAPSATGMFVWCWEFVSPLFRILGRPQCCQQPFSSKITARVLLVDQWENGFVMPRLGHYQVRSKHIEAFRDEWCRKQNADQNGKNFWSCILWRLLNYDALL